MTATHPTPWDFAEQLARIDRNRVEIARLLAEANNPKRKIPIEVIVTYVASALSLTISFATLLGFTQH